MGFALLGSLCDLSAVLMNVQRSLIRKMILYNFEINNYVTELLKYICK